MKAPTARMAAFFILTIDIEGVVDMEEYLRGKVFALCVFGGKTETSKVRKSRSF